MVERLDGLDENYKEENKTGVVSVEEHKNKRQAFHYWDVKGVSHKLKLQTGMMRRKLGQPDTPACCLGLCPRGRDMGGSSCRG